VCLRRYGFAFLGAVFQEREDQLCLRMRLAPSISFDVAHFEQLAYVLCLEFG